MCGDKSVDWSALVYNLLMFSHIMMNLGPSNAPVPLPVEENCLIHEDLELLIPLYIFRTSLSTDARDKGFRAPWSMQTQIRRS